MRAFMLSVSIATFACSSLAVAPARGQTKQARAEVRGPGGKTAKREVEAGGGRREAVIERSGPAVQRRVETQRAPGSASRSFEITGPRGATYQREVSVQRQGGAAERDIHIQRPGGASFDRQVRVAQQPQGGFGTAGQGPGGRPVVVNRSVVVNNRTVVNRGGGWGWGPPVAAGGLSSFSFFFGAPPAPPPLFVPAPVIVAPPPLVAVPAPVIVEAPPPQVIVQEPERYREEAPPQPETIVFDPVRDALKRLASRHDNSRRDGALTLGRLGDARAVPALIERLRFDEDTDVRAAAAYALGEIGDPKAAGPLRRAALYDRKKAVRDEATLAMDRLEDPRPLQTEALPAEGTPPSPTTFHNAVPAPPDPGLFPEEPSPLPDPLPPIEGPLNR